MIRMNDVYYKVGSQLMLHDFDNKNVEEKKELVDKELKNYVIAKISELGYSQVINSHNNDVNLNDLVEVLGERIPVENHFATLRHLTHFIINIAGEMQEHSIIWWNESGKEYKNLPVANFNEEGLWDDIHTYEDDSYVRTFEFVYDMFVNRFLKRVKVNKKVLNT